MIEPVALNEVPAGPIVAAKVAAETAAHITMTAPPSTRIFNDFIIYVLKPVCAA
ncbi:hypothetical protein [Paraburkholderia megapolitana]|uniref:hypothetical protein n=1 Tax=Paraburkholderia megapolitana TaxID=420953 RepID=UPI00147896C8|nr:hypothetical protein [Paraburkholderia megapolitana]